MTETDLLNATLDLAKVYGWKRLHIRPAKTDHGYRTPVQGDGKGFPDLLLLNLNRVVAAELKGIAGKCTEEQLEWLYAFDEAGAETHIWNPSDWHSGAILKTLKGEAVPASIEAPQK